MSANTPWTISVLQPAQDPLHVRVAFNVSLGLKKVWKKITYRVL